MRTALALVASIALASCASSGIVPIGQGIFMVSKGLAAPGVPGANVLASIYAEANAHCATSGKELETVSATSLDPIPFVRAGSAKLEFRCVTPLPSPQEPKTVTPQG